MAPMTTMPATPLAQHDRAVLDFVKVLKSSEGRERMPMLRQEFASRVGDWSAQTGRAPASREDVDEVIGTSVPWRFDRALSRFSQELMYQRVHDLLKPRRSELSAFLNEPTPNALGTVRTNPNMVIPDWFQADYHVQPGGMHREELIGFITNVTQKVYFGGNNDNFEMQVATARAAPRGDWKRVLDVGCGTKSAFALKAEFPDAVVYGIDMSAAQVKYAHKYAEALGTAIHFSQQNAEATDFPEGFFDLITSCIVFHEMPDSAAANVIRDGFRILKPGGWYLIGDAAPYRSLDPFAQFFTDWQTGNNIEPYWRQAGLRNLPDLLRAVGFVNISDPSTNGPTSGRIFPWVTRAQKPE